MCGQIEWEADRENQVVGPRFEDEDIEERLTMSYYERKAKLLSAGYFQHNDREWFSPGAYAHFFTMAEAYEHLSTARTPANANDREFQRLLELAFDYETSQKLLQKGTNR